jgi:hypothetical protein
MTHTQKNTQHTLASPRQGGHGGVRLTVALMRVEVQQSYAVKASVLHRTSQPAN